MRLAPAQSHPPCVSSVYETLVAQRPSQHLDALAPWLMLQQQHQRFSPTRLSYALGTTTYLPEAAGLSIAAPLWSESCVDLVLCPPCACAPSPPGAAHCVRPSFRLKTAAMHASRSVPGAPTALQHRHICLQHSCLVAPHHTPCACLASVSVSHALRSVTTLELLELWRTLVRARTNRQHCLHATRQHGARARRLGRLYKCSYL